MECSTESFIVGPTQIPCSIFIAHAFNFIWSMPANSGTLSQARVCSHYKPRGNMPVKSALSSGTWTTINIVAIA